jgi:hypothetical protein
MAETVARKLEEGLRRPKSGIGSDERCGQLLNGQGLAPA